MVFDLQTSTSFEQIVKKLLVLVIIFSSCVFAMYGLVAASIQVFAVRRQPNISWFKAARFRLGMLFVAPILAALWGALATTAINVVPVICIAGIYRNIPSSMTGTEAYVIAVLLTLATVLAHHI